MFKVKRDQHRIKQKIPKAVFSKPGQFQLKRRFFHTQKYAHIVLYF